MITIIGVPFEVNIVFKQRRFWATLVNQKQAFFFSICPGTTKFELLSVFTLNETIFPKFVQNHGSRVQKVHFRPVDVCRSNTSPVKVLLKIVTENGIYSPLMKVISNSILLVYSLRGALIKIARGCHTQWRNFFDGTTPLLEKVRRYLAAFPYADYSKLNSNWHTCTNPRPGQYLTHAQSHITQALAILSISSS